MRAKEFAEVKNLIINFFKLGDYGIFNSRNILGDPMDNIFTGEYFIVDICYHYSYFEVFGCNDEEWKTLTAIYNTLKN